MKLIDTQTEVLYLPVRGSQMASKHDWPWTNGTLYTILVILIFGSTHSAYGIAYWESDAAIVEGDPNKEPADLLHPDHAVTARVETSFIAGSGAVIAPNWIVSNAHVMEDFLDPGNDPFSAGFHIDGSTYKAGADPFTGEPMIFLHPDWTEAGPLDVALVRIVTLQGADANLIDNWTPMGELPSIGAVTIGGRGLWSVGDGRGNIWEKVGNTDLH